MEPHGFGLSPLPFSPVQTLRRALLSSIIYLFYLSILWDPHLPFPLPPPTDHG